MCVRKKHTDTLMSSPIPFIARLTDLDVRNHQGAEDGVEREGRSRRESNLHSAVLVHQQGLVH